MNKFNKVYGNKTRGTSGGTLSFKGNSMANLKCLFKLINPSFLLGKLKVAQTDKSH